MRDRQARAEADLADMNEVIASAQVRIETYQDVLVRRDEIEVGLNRLKQARAAVKDWDRRLQESARLSDRRHELDVALNAARAALEADLREVETKIKTNQIDPVIGEELLRKARFILEML